MKYITNFETTAAYNTAKDNLITPNVSYIEETNGVAYKPYVPPTPHDYVEIGGIKWATMNVGASSITDTGLYFQWGDAQGYTAAQVGTDKQFTWNDYKYWTADTGSGSSGFTKYNGSDYTVLQAEDDAVTAAWGGGWRMPTTAELTALGNAVNTAWTQVNGVYGFQCTDKQDSSKVLFFPAVGYAANGSVSDKGDLGYYWTNSLNSDQVGYPYHSNFDAWAPYWWRSYCGRYNGLPVRGVLDA